MNNVYKPSQIWIFNMDILRFLLICIIISELYDTFLVQRNEYTFSNAVHRLLMMSKQNIVYSRY